MASKQAILATVVALSIASTLLVPPNSHPVAPPPPSVALTAVAEPIDFSALSSDPALAQQLSDTIGSLLGDPSESPADAVPGAAFVGLGFLLRLPFLVFRLLRLAWVGLTALWHDLSNNAGVAEAAPALSVAFDAIPTGLPDTTFPDIGTALPGPADAPGPADVVPDFAGAF